MTDRPHLHRRRFLSSLTAASAVGLCAPVLRAAEAAGLQLGIQMYSLRGLDHEEALKIAAEIGFKQVEYYRGMLPIEATDDQIAQVRDQVGQLGMSISAHGVNRFDDDAAHSRRVFEFARRLGIKTITADPSPAALEHLDELVGEFDIRIAIHNHGPRHRYNRVVDVLRAIENHDPRIGACADLGHFIRSGEDATEVVRLLQGRLYGVHLKDFAEQKDKTQGVILGRGHLDVGGVIDALLAVDFPADGALSLEYEENPQDPVDDIRQCYQIAEAAIVRAKAVRR